MKIDLKLYFHSRNQGSNKSIKISKILKDEEICWKLIKTMGIFLGMIKSFDYNICL